MKKLLFAFVFLTGTYGYVFPQAITVSTPLMNFGTVYENAPDSLQLVLTNTLSRDVHVNGFRFYQTYGVPAFSAGENYFVIPASSSHTVWIRFAPRHNIFHNSELVILNDG